MTDPIQARVRRVAELDERRHSKGLWKAVKGRVHFSVKTANGHFVMEPGFPARAESDARFAAEAPAMAQLIKDLAAELEASRTDAARYRWLRDPQHEVAKVIDKVTGESERGLHGEFNGYNYEYRSGEELDAAIDSAISATSTAAEGK